VSVPLNSVSRISGAQETVLALAMATGRTLVLPPSQQMYLLGDTTFSFADFFPLHEIAKEHPGLDIITMQVFLERTHGKWVDKVTGRPSIPPGNRTNWDGDTIAVKTRLNLWLQSVASNPDWNPAKCLAAFPASTQPEDVVSLQETFDHIVQNVHPILEEFVNHPTPVNASVLDRMTEFMANRKQICLYTNELQEEPLLHYHGKKTLGGRLLVHFYAFLFFQDWKEDLWTKRFIRDHVRYVDEIQCAAARVVEAVRQHARDKGTSADGIFDSFHIRRGDFQYKKTRLGADEIYDNSKDVIPEGTTVFVATDERSSKFFEPMAEHWDLLYLKDFQHLIDGIDKNFYGK
jgi:GDP-fucose protein O-fucosyltransferase